jgi:hypothetical protein
MAEWHGTTSNEEWRRPETRAEVQPLRVTVAVLGKVRIDVVRVELVGGGRVLVRSPLRREVVRIEVV